MDKKETPSWGPRSCTCHRLRVSSLDQHFYLPHFGPHFLFKFGDISTERALRAHFACRMGGEGQFYFHASSCLVNHFHNLDLKQRMSKDWEEDSLARESRFAAANARL